MKEPQKNEKLEDILKDVGSIRNAIETLSGKGFTLTWHTFPEEETTKLGISMKPIKTQSDYMLVQVDGLLGLHVYGTNSIYIPVPANEAKPKQ